MCCGERNRWICVGYVVNLTGMEPIIENGLVLFKYSGEGGRKKLCSGQNERSYVKIEAKKNNDFVVVHGDSVEVIMNKWKLRFGECDTFPSSG